MANSSGGGSSRLRGAISGTWYLLDQAADEMNIPVHRTDLLFREESEQFRAAVLSRVSGEEMLVIHSASFDGEVLRLQMVAEESPRARGWTPSDHVLQSQATQLPLVDHALAGLLDRAVLQSAVDGCGRPGCGSLLAPGGR